MVRRSYNAIESLNARFWFTPGRVQSGLVGSGRDRRRVLTVPSGFVFGGWDVSDLAVESALVVPVDSLDDRELRSVRVREGPWR
jgi:hypothetical protein